MNRAENLINFYQTGFKVCLVLAVVFLILTVILFFRFDIRRIIANRTGRAQRKTIEQMKEANERTGRLRHAEKVARGEYTPISLNAEGMEKQRNNAGYESHSLQAEETMQLSKAMVQEKDSVSKSVNGRSGHIERKKTSHNGKFVIIKEVLIIHTDEWI